MKNFLGWLIGAVIVWLLAWLLGGIILTLAIRHCWFVHTIATSLGVAEGSFVNYANASLVIGMLSTLKINFNSKK